MARWLRLVIFSVICIVALLLLGTAIWYLIPLKSGQVVVLNFRKDFRLQVNPATQKIFNEEIEKMGSERYRGKTLIWFSPAYKKTIDGAGVRGQTFVYSEWVEYVGMPVLKVYLDKDAYNSLNPNTASESLGYLLIRQMLIERGVTTQVEINKIAYKYGILKPQLFTFTQIN